MRHNPQSCRVCLAEPEVRDAINAEIRQRHGYRRISARWGMKKSLVHVHGQWFLSEKLRERKLAETCPEKARFFLVTADGKREEMLSMRPYDPYHRIDLESLPVIEIVLDYEDPVPPRATTPVLHEKTDSQPIPEN